MFHVITLRVVIGSINTLLKSCSKNVEFTSSMLFRGFAVLLSPGEVDVQKTKNSILMFFVFQISTSPGLGSSPYPIKNTDSFKSTILEQLLKRVFIGPTTTGKVITWDKNKVL